MPSLAVECKPNNNGAVLERAVDGRFQAGSVPNPHGRPKGSRNKVSEAFLQDMHDLWQRRGMQILEKVAESDPAKVLAAMVQILPKDFQLSVDADQINWVINASPRLTVEEWQAEHGIEAPTVGESSTE